MKNNTTPAVIQPFSTKPTVMIVASASAKEMNEKLQLGKNLGSGTSSLKKRDVVMAAVRKLVGNRRGNESAGSWAARAQKALDERFA
ncbi:MAG: hypothetical protein KA004_18905 [Verrucomicrobiales bacterium]|nr:hypothetical protein [Verrucomicrobiales bacterium]